MPAVSTTTMKVNNEHEMAPVTGFEPTISGLTSRRFKPLSYTGALVDLVGVEPT